jgi:hypothetical protein
MSVPPTWRAETKPGGARSGLIVALLSSGVVACSGLLDLPSDPYLAVPPPALDGGLPSPLSPGANPRPVGGGVEVEPGSEVVPGTVQGIPPDQMMSATGNGPRPPVEIADGGVEAPPDAALAPSCPIDATLGEGGRCYARVLAPLPWADGRVECQSIGDGWDLASIRDAAENELVAELTGDEAWLGGSDAELEGNWIWVDDSEPFWSGSGVTGAAVDGAFENWNSDEPNGGGPSDCLRLVADLGTWADLECTFERAALCEGPAR